MMLKLIFLAIPLLWAQFTGLGGNGQPGYSVAPPLPTTDLLDAWEADDITSCSGTVTGTWPKLAGSVTNGLVVTGTPTCNSTAVNGHAAVTLNGTTDFFGADTNVIPTNSSTNRYIAFYAVIKPSVSTSAGALTSINGTGADAPVLKLDSANKQELDKQDITLIGTSTTAVNTSAWHEVGMVYDGTTVTFYLDGVADGTGSVAASFGQGTTRIGVNYDTSNNPTEFFHGQIAAIYLYANNSGAITNEAAVHAYLLAKYGI